MLFEPCLLIETNELPTLDLIEIYTKSVYVKFDNQLYYINANDKQLVQIELTPDAFLKLNEFHTKRTHNQNLSPGELIELGDITGHRHIHPCEAIKVDIEPTTDNIDTINIEYKHAYVRFHNQLYYVDKSKGTCEQVNTDASIIKQIDQICTPSEISKLLDYGTLFEIADKTNHRHISLLPIPDKIPDIIHFIWLGGPIPEKYLRTIIDVARIAKTSGFTFNLWMDDDSIKNIEKTLKKMDLSLSYLESLGINIININTLKPIMNNDPFYTADASYPKRDKADQFWEYVDRETVGNKNYAAASDLLRYEILRQYGGYYFDTDTKFLFISQPSKPDYFTNDTDKAVYSADLKHFRSFEKDIREGKRQPIKFTSFRSSTGIVVDVFLRYGINQPYSWEKDCTNNYSITRVGNDLIASLPSHPFITTMINSALNHYRELYQSRSKFKIDDSDKKRQPYIKTKLSEDEYRLDENPHRLSLTLQVSGPDLLLKHIDHYIRNNTNQSAHELSSITFNQFPFPLGVKIIGASDATWLVKNEVTGYDDQSTTKLYKGK